VKTNGRKLLAESSARKRKQRGKPAPRPAGVIRDDTTYTLEEFRARTGLGEAWLRGARRSGLRVIYLAGRAFVRGRSFADFLERLGSEDLGSSKGSLAAALEPGAPRRPG
jgi:hypothetical protein